MNEEKCEIIVAPMVGIIMVSESDLEVIKMASHIDGRIITQFGVEIF